VGWAGRRLVGQLAASLLLLTRAIPLLLFFALVLLLTTEMWQAFAQAPDAVLAAVARRAPESGALLSAAIGLVAIGMSIYTVYLLEIVKAPRAAARRREAELRRSA
jgi:hypothetical protein